MRSGTIILLALLSLLTLHGFSGEEERLFPYGGPSSTEIAELGNPYMWEEFVDVLNRIYSNEEICKPWFEAHEKGLTLNEKLIPWKTPTANRTWRPSSELPPLTDRTKPLEGMKIAIDPGHLGGEWAEMEQRDNIIARKFRVCEGVSTQIIATLLSRSLKDRGADVKITRLGSRPATDLRPEGIARRMAALRKTPLSPEILKEAESLFLRRVEINARAALLREYNPDLTLCLHFDAGNIDAPVDRLHLILNGAYTPSEIADDDLRTGMLAKLLGRVHEEELAVSKVVARVMAEKMKLPPLTYAPSESVREIPDEPYLWYRNLLANCLFPGPVIFLEPYAMNNELTARRMTLGDYEGTRVFNGKRYKSIYREYSEAVTEGLAAYYLQARTKK